MRMTAKKAEKDFQQSGHFLAPGPITDYMPKWVPEKVNGLEAIRTHAHWVAAYWGRALTQLAAQSATDAQSVSLEDLLTEFLNMNRMCVETKGKLGWLMDQQIWNGIADKIQRHDPNLDMQQEFTVVDQNVRNGLISDLGLQNQQRGQQQQTNARKGWSGPQKSGGKGKASGRGHMQQYGKGYQQHAQYASQPYETSGSSDGKTKTKSKGKGKKSKGDRPRPGQSGFQPKKEQPEH